MQQAVPLVRPDEVSSVLLFNRELALYLLCHTFELRGLKHDAKTGCYCIVIGNRDDEETVTLTTSPDRGDNVSVHMSAILKAIANRLGLKVELINVGGNHLDRQVPASSIWKQSHEHKGEQINMACATVSFAWRSAKSDERKIRTLHYLSALSDDPLFVFTQAVLGMLLECYKEQIEQ